MGGANGIGATATAASVGTWANSVAADFIPASPALELAAGRTVYSVTITNTTGTTGNTMTATNLAGALDGLTSAADINLDGVLDVVVTPASATQGLYVWDARTASLIASQTGSLAGSSAGMAFVGDVDNDGKPDLGYCRPGRLYMLSYNGTTTLATKWVLTTSDASGVTGLSMFDFNQDGKAEIVYRDETQLRIIDGSTATPSNLAVISSRSDTGLEMPVVADIDNDGQAEIVIGDQTGLATSGTGYMKAYKSDAQPWAPARNVWNQLGYHNTNIDDQLKVPAYEQNYSFIFTPNPGTGAGATQRPLNNFLQQASPRDRNGLLVYPSSDAVISNVSVGCSVGNTVVVTYTITNNGEAALDASTPIRFYAGDPLTTTGAIFSVSATVGSVLQSGQSKVINTTVDYTGTAAPFNLFVSVNDDGLSARPFAFPTTAIPECNYGNNVSSIGGVGLTVQVTSATVCSGQSGTLTASGADSYSWSSGETTPSITVITPGTYTVTGTAASGCSATATATLANITCTTQCTYLLNPDFENTQITATSGIYPQNQGVIAPWKTTATDQNQEIWRSGFNSVPSYSGQQFIELNAYENATTYQNFTAPGGTTLTLNFAHRGRSGNDVMHVGIGTPDPTQITKNQPPLTGTEYLDLGSFTDGNTRWGYYSVTFTLPTNATNFSVRFTAVSATGGTAAGNFLDAISLAAPAPVTTPSSTTVNCAQPKVNLTTTFADSNGGTITWHTGFIATAANLVADPTAVGAGTYYGAFYDAGTGCYSATSLVTVSNVALPAAVFTITNPSCASPTGSFTVTSPVGPDYSYSIGTTGIYQASPIFTNVNPGSYIFRARFGTGTSCTSQARVVTIAAAPAVPTVTATSATACAGQSATLTASGATSYSWSSGETTPSITVSTPGTYTVTGTATSGCSATATATLSICTPPAPSTPVATAVNNPISPGTPTGSISLTGTTGTYTPNTPVSVTYTTPSGTTAVFTGTTDGTGTIVIPNLPAGTYGPFTVSLDGSTPTGPSNTVTLVDPAPSTPVATVVNNPLTPGGSTGSISLTGTTGTYTPNTPVSVTYTTPSGTTTVFTGTTDGTGTITIPNLPAGIYGPFVVSLNGGTPTSPGGSVTLVNPVPADLTPIIYGRPSPVYNTSSIMVVVDVVELNNVPSSGLITVKISKDNLISLSFSASTTSLDNHTVQNSVWSFDDSSDENYYLLTTNSVVGAGGQLSFGLTGTLTPGFTTGTVTISAVVVSGSGGEVKVNNNTDADRIEYFQR